MPRKKKTETEDIAKDVEKSISEYHKEKLRSVVEKNMKGTEKKKPDILSKFMKGVK